MPIIFYSTEDAAGTNVARFLKDVHGFEAAPDVVEKGRRFRAWASDFAQLLELETRLAFDSDYVGDFFYSDLFVFASRHRSEAGNPCFTVHATGDWARKQLSATSARAIKTAFDFLAKNPVEGFDVTLEATHHRPVGLKTPSLFIEVGSSEREWENPGACGLVAECIVEVCKNYAFKECKPVIGVGAGHYCPSFNELEAKDYGFSHIAAKYALDHIDSKAVRQAIEKTAEQVECAVIDWKGCTGEQRKKITAALEENGLSYEKI